MLEFSVLLIESDPGVRLLLKLALELVGGHVFEVGEPIGALRAAYDAEPDAVVVGLEQETSRHEIVGRLRDLGPLPIVAIGAGADAAAARRALSSGANDYVARGSNPEEVARRTRSLLERVAPHARKRPAYRDDRLYVDFNAIEVQADGTTVALTPLEFRVLEALLRRPNEVLSADALLNVAWQDGDGHPERVKPHVAGLRRKLGGLGQRIVTLRGHGYSYRAFDA